MINGSVMAAYLAATVVSKTDRRLTPAMSTALDRLRVCVTAKLGARPVAELLSQPPRAAALEVIGSALDAAARDDDEFARQLGVIFDELEGSGARFLIDDARERYRDNEAADTPDSDERSGRVIRCDTCGEFNPSGVEFCLFCGAFLALDDSPPQSSSAEDGPTSPARVDERLTQSAGEDSPPTLSATRQTPSVRSSPPSPSELPGSRSDSAASAALPAPPVDTVPLQELIDRAVSQAVTEGRVLFNPPERMRQGRLERVEVAIARTKDLDDVLRQMVRGRGQAHIEDVETSPFMAVELKGRGFDVTPLQGAGSTEQLLHPTALWEFDVLPKRSGSQTLQVSVAMRIPLLDRPDERISIPVLERHIQVVIDPRYGSQQFLKRNWQWLIATLAGLGGAVAA
jgi:hypothetical protein